MTAKSKVYSSPARRSLFVATAFPVLLSLMLLTVEGTRGQQRANTDAAVIVDWNRLVLQIAEGEDGFLTLKGLRTAAMIHLAIHDAVNSISREYSAYSYAESNPNADPLAAAASAAHAVAVSQYPDHRERLDEQLNASLRNSGTAASRKRGLAVGEAAANAILQARADDGWNSEAEYKWHPMGPGVYAEFNEHSGTPEGFVFGAGWGAATPFALDSADQFRSPPPPEINSDDYTRAFNEVKEVGRFQSPTRTIDQTHLALWWKDFAENSHNRLARDLVLKEHLPLVEANRLFALVNMAIFDAYVSSFENKFQYNHWRPYTAIRWAANDGNPYTEPEETWTNLHRHTYAFPSYPSAHGTACGASMTAFAQVFGDAYPFTMRIETVDVSGPMSGKIEMHPPVRSFERFADAAVECGLSRVYLGIHFRYDSEAGVVLGRQIGRFLVDTHLTPK